MDSKKPAPAKGQVWNLTDDITLTIDWVSKSGKTLTGAIDDRMYNGARSGHRRMTTAILHRCYDLKAKE